jgi:hypothetical protein
MWLLFNGYQGIILDLEKTKFLAIEGFYFFWDFGEDETASNGGAQPA